MTGAGQSMPEQIKGMIAREIAEFQVMDRAGRLLHTECLGSGLSGTGSEPFLVYQHTLFYVSQNNSLSAIQLVN